MSDFQIKPATRTGVIPMIGMYGRSGTGKTFSALMLARGLVGPTGRISVLDTENCRASLFADIVPGGYQVINFEPPFSPERYSEALDVLQANSDVAILDSMTHEHDGEGGVLEMHEAELQRMAGDDYKRREACKMAAWIKPKMRHKIFIQKLLRSKIPLICCLRAQEKTHIAKGDDGKSKVITDEFTSPIYDSRFIFELLCNIETVMLEGKPGCGIIRKWSHPELLKCLPRPGEQITIAHGTAIAAWCNSPHKLAPVPKATASAADAELTAAKKTLWDMTDHIHKGNPKGLNQWLIDERFIEDTEQLGTLSVSRIKSVIDKIKIKLNPQPASEPIKELIP